MTTTNLRLRHTNRRLARPSRREAGLEKNRSTLVQDGVAGVARRALRGAAGGRLAAFPVAVRFWDGSVKPACACAGAVGAPTVLVRNRRSLSELLREPNEIGLTRAWVQRDLDVEGDLEAVVALRERYAGLQLATRVTDVLRSIEISSLEIRDVESLREHYVLTLRRWIANLDAQRESAIREVGEMRLRAWRLYLLGCAHAFATGQISVFQTLSARGGADHNLPLSRRALMA